MGTYSEFKTEIDIDTWLKMADTANTLMIEMGWDVRTTNTMA